MSAVVLPEDLDAARALVAEWRTAHQHPEKRPGAEGFLVGLIAAALADARPVEDGDRTVEVPLAALRALVLDARQTSASLDDHFDGEPVALHVTDQLVEALGVAELRPAEKPEPCCPCGDDRGQHHGGSGRCLLCPCAVYRGAFPVEHLHVGTDACDVCGVPGAHWACDGRLFASWQDLPR